MRTLADNQAQLLTRIGTLVSEEAPPGWERIELTFRQLGRHTELEALAVCGEASRSFACSEQIRLAFTELRALMYEPGQGTWLQARWVLRSSGEVDFEVDTEHWWTVPPPDLAALLDEELEAFPREPAHLPDTWRRALGLALGKTFRQARVVEGELPVPEAELPLLLRYLEGPPEVLLSSGFGVDAVSDGTEVDVPQSYHTDGT